MFRIIHILIEIFILVLICIILYNLWTKYCSVRKSVELLKSGNAGRKRTLRRLSPRRTRMRLSGSDREMGMVSQQARPEIVASQNAGFSQQQIVTHHQMEEEESSNNIESELQKELADLDATDSSSESSS